MRILIIDEHPHEELKNELNKYGIILDHKIGFGENICFEEYSLVILCPSSRQSLADMLGNNSMEDLNWAVIFDCTDDKFINLCIRLGCKDVIKKPYQPEITAKRLHSLLKSLEVSEESDIISDEYEETCTDTENFINREIKRANRNKTPVSFIAIRPMESHIPSEELKMTVDKFKAYLRDTDFAACYKDFILIILPSCDNNGLEAVKAKLEKCAGRSDLFFCGLVKDRYYDVFVEDEKEDIFERLKDKLKRPFP